MRRVIIAMEIGLLLYTAVATLCCWRINVKRWIVHPPGFTLQNNIDCFIVCGASAKGFFLWTTGNSCYRSLTENWKLLLQEIL
jgi:hypothetical protein